MKRRTLLQAFKNAEQILTSSKKLTLCRSDIHAETRILARLSSSTDIPLIPTSNELKNMEMTHEEYNTFMDFVKRRSNAEPISYLTGEKEFWSMSLMVNSDTLIPRPDTETLIESMLHFSKHKKTTVNSSFPSTCISSTVLDLYTGAGPLLLAALHELPNSTGVGIDISSGAVNIAKQNAKRHNLSNRCTFLVEDLHNPKWFSNVKYDYIFANPPYIPLEDYKNLMLDVKDFEPRDALVGDGEDGMGSFRMLAKSFQENRLQFNDSDSLLIMEVGINQSEKVVELFERNCGMRLKEIRLDYGGMQRSVVMSKKSK